MQKLKSSRGGFTLVEVIVVLVILAILAAIMIPSMTGWIDKANEKKAFTEIRLCALAARSAYAEVYGKYNIAENDQFVYIAGIPSAVAANEEFKKAFEEYLNDSGVFENVNQVRMAQQYLGISYTYDNTKYNYVDADGKVTITKA